MAAQIDSCRFVRVSFGEYIYYSIFFRVVKGYWAECTAASYFPAEKKIIHNPRTTKSIPAPRFIYLGGTT
jgi:hypothetical protein